MNTMRDHEKKIRYVDIAEASGISLATISRVLNKSPNVKDETRRQVLDAMQALGHDTTGLDAPALAAGNLIIFNIPSLDNPFYSLIVQGARAAALRNRYNLLLNEDPINEKTVDDFIELLRQTKAVGLILTNCISKSLLKRLGDLLSVVQCCECVPELPYPFVTINDVTAARNAVEYIVSLGKKRIAFINGPLKYKYAQGRLQGYQEALQAAGLVQDPDLVIQMPEINYEMALSSAFQLLNSPKRPDAFFASSDVYAAAAIKAVSRIGLRVPEDVAVVGFDNIEISYMCTPSITTVNQPRYQLGLLSCDLLSKLINKETIPIQHMYLETELIVRESTNSALMRRS